MQLPKIKEISPFWLPFVETKILRFSCSLTPVNVSVCSYMKWRAISSRDISQEAQLSQAVAGVCCGAGEPNCSRSMWVLLLQCFVNCECQGCWAKSNCPCPDVLSVRDMQGAVLGCTCVLTRAFPKLGRILPHRKPTETGLWLVRREKRSGSIAFLAALEMLQPVCTEG